MRTGRAVSTVFATLCAVAASLAVSVALAGANEPREVGSFSLPSPGYGGIGVEQASRDVFVVDGGQHVVQKWNPGGSTLLGEFGGGETPAQKFGPLADGVAVDQSSDASKGDVYVADGFEPGGGVVDKLKPKAVNPNEYEYVCQLTGPGGGCVKEGGEPTSHFLYSLGVTVDAEGTVYVACYGSKVVYEFDSEGNYLGELVGKDIEKPGGVAAGAGRTLYVTNLGGTTAKVTLNSSHTITSESVLDPHQTSGVAVDPTTGNVYVTDAEGGWHVVVYDPNGSLVEEFANKGELVEAWGIAYSAQDARTYVIDRRNERVVVFSEPPVTEIGPASGVSSSSAKLTGTVNPEGPSAEWYFQYGETTGYGSTTAPGVVTSTGEVSATIEGLQPGTIYHYRLVAVNSHGPGRSLDGTFRTPAGVEDLAAMGVSQFSATLEATLDPGLIPASYHFEYGTTTAYGSIAPIPDLYAVPGYAENKISQVIAGLRPGTTYHYALVAADVAGIVSGPDETFTTPSVPAPAVSTGGAVGVSRSTAGLTGTIDPMGWDTIYHFEYGTSTTYGSSWPTVDVDMGALTGSQPVLITLENLQPGTTYHYRLVATNPGGTSYGADQTFTTGEYPLSVIQEAPVLTAKLGFVDPEAKTGKSTGKSLTRAQKLANALKACRRKPRAQRGRCEKQARARYGPTIKKKK
jgi:hypothetical protein